MSVTKGEVIALAKALGGAAAARTSVKTSIAAGGSVVSISDGADGLKAQSLVVGFSPIQDLHGQAAPYPAGGGKNLFNIDTIAPFNSNVTVDKTADSFTVTNANDFSATCFTNGEQMIRYPVTDGKYTISIGTVTTVNIGIYGSTDGESFSWLSDGITAGGTYKTFTISGQTYIQFRCYCPANATVTIEKFQFEKGESKTTYAPYSNICPISGRTGLNVYHSGEDTSNPTIYPISWQTEAGTVYGGTVDVVSGVLTVTHGVVTFDGTQNDLSFAAGSTANRIGWNGYISIGKNGTPFLSDTLKTSANATSIKGDPWLIYNASTDPRMFITVPTTMTSASDFNTYCTSNPITVVYTLATPQTYQLTPQTVRMLLGVNNVWASDGTIQSMDYTADTKLYIDAVAPHGDGIADGNINNGDFFMDGNQLYVATATIAAGDALVPGTNCTEMSIADALNSLNS